MLEKFFRFYFNLLEGVKEFYKFMEDDVGFDLFCIEDVNILFWENKIVGIGVRV